MAKTSQHRAHMQEGFGSNFLLGRPNQRAASKAPIHQILPRRQRYQRRRKTPRFSKSARANTASPYYDRSISHESSLEDAVRALLVLFDSTIRSNLSVGFPIDLMVYHRNSCTLPAGIRVDDSDPICTTSAPNGRKASKPFCSNSTCRPIITSNKAQAV